MKLIYLLRHGQASFGAGNYDRLSETGELQCRILGEYFAQTGITFDHLYHGSMQRLRDSSRIVLENAPGCFSSINPVEISDLNEHDSDGIIKSQIPGLIEDEPELAGEVTRFFSDKHSFQQIFTRVMARWVSGEHDAPGIEPFIDFNKRVAAAIEHIASDLSDNEKAAVFTSGGVIASAIQTALAISDVKAMRLPWWTRNASITALRRTDNSSDLLCFNSTAHLELKNDAALLTYK